MTNSDTRERDPRRSNSDGRRAFLKWMGAGAGVAVLASGCDVLVPPNGDAEPGDVELDFSNDFGVLNYAYALEQLESAFYTEVIANPFSGITEEEMRVLRDLRDHEIAHREFYQSAIPTLGGSIIPMLTVDFSDVDFSSRTSVLETARVFEDLGVAAYNGAGRLLVSADVLLVAGKIVSVEARHAAAIRDLLQPMSMYFAGDDVVDANGLDRAFEPPAVLEAAGPYIENEITVTNL